MLSRCFLDFSVGVGAFVIGLSQISFFFSFYPIYRVFYPFTTAELCLSEITADDMF